MNDPFTRIAKFVRAWLHTYSVNSFNDKHKMTIIDTKYDCNWSRAQNHLVLKRTLNNLAKLASLAKWLNVCLRTKWFWVRAQLQSLKLQISHLLQARSSLIFRLLQSWIHSETRTWHDKNIQTKYDLWVISPNARNLKKTNNLSYHL